MTYRSLLFVSVIAASPAFAVGAHADIRADVARCAAIAEDAARLQCYDTAAADMQAARDADANRASEALKREFRFDRGILTGPLSLRLKVSGNLVLSRDTAAGREVEETARRITKALGDIEGWSLSVIVHGGRVSLSRGNPYSGAELLAQSRNGMARSGLPEDRYTVALGPDAEPELWDDGRVRNANEHIDIEIIGLSDTPTR